MGSRRNRALVGRGRLVCGRRVPHWLDDRRLGDAPRPASRRTGEAAERSRSASKIRVHGILSTFDENLNLDDLFVGKARPLIKPLRPIR
jgi:hypothetical protein